MGRTLIEKIIADHTSDPVVTGEPVELTIDVRVARDFGGASVVTHLENHGLSVADPARTFFTFDCNPTGSDQGYATNQQKCRIFARRHGIRVFDINRGIGTHLAIEEDLAGPGDTFISTDSHANILGAICAFGQGMGDLDIAHAFSYGTVWFKVPPTVRIRLVGIPSTGATAKDLTLAMLRHFGADGLLGCAAEVEGSAVDSLDLAGRITLASMATEMGAIILFPQPSDSAARELTALTGIGKEWPLPDPDAQYLNEIDIDVNGLEPLASRPGHPEDVIEVSELEGQPVDSAFIGSCTNGRFEDLEAAAAILEGRVVAEGVILKVVPSTDRVWMEALERGLVQTFKKSGAMFSSCGCAGCAAGQVGQTGEGEITVSTGNRNFIGKQGLGSVYLASPVTAAASAIAGMLTTAERLDDVLTSVQQSSTTTVQQLPEVEADSDSPTFRQDEPQEIVEGNAWVLETDSVDTDMIYHNRHLAITDISEMGRHALGNIPGWEDFPEKVERGDVLVVGANFGAGSSRQHAVDCFRALGVGAIIGASFGAIYERNAVNAGLPLLIGDLRSLLQTGDTIRVDLEAGSVERMSDNTRFQITPMSLVQLRIYRRGGLLSDR